MCVSGKPEWTGVCYTNPRLIASGEWTLNLVGVSHGNKAGLVIYSMDVCNWKYDAVHNYQLTVTNSSAKGRLRDVNIHKACASYIYARAGCISKTPYLVMVLLNTNGRDIVNNAACEYT